MNKSKMSNNTPRIFFPPVIKCEYMIAFVLISIQFLIFYYPVKAFFKIFLLSFYFCNMRQLFCLNRRFKKTRALFWFCKISASYRNLEMYNISFYTYKKKKKTIQLSLFTWFIRGRRPREYWLQICEEWSRPRWHY